MSSLRKIEPEPIQKIIPSWVATQSLLAQPMPLISCTTDQVVSSPLLLSMMTVSLTFYAVASSNPDPVVVDDAYQAGLRYNEALRAQQRAEALGYRVDLTLDPASDAVGVEVVLRDAAGRAVRPEAVSVRRVRPTLGGFDADFELSAAERGFAGSIPLPLPGRW